LRARAKGELLMVALWVILGVLGAIGLFIGVFEIGYRINKKRNRNSEFKDYKLANTAGRNSDGTKRQDILDGVNKRKGEYRKLEYTIREYRAKNAKEDSLGVYVNGHQVGDIPQEDARELIAGWDRIEHIAQVKIHGGKSLGASVTIQLKKQG
jgi:hypothetical protein